MLDKLQNVIIMALTFSLVYNVKYKLHELAIVRRRKPVLSWSYLSIRNNYQREIHVYMSTNSTLTYLETKNINYRERFVEVIFFAASNNIFICLSRSCSKLSKRLEKIEEEK
jgi:hypothetical protein